VTCCLFTSLIMLPAALTWMTRHRKQPLPADPRVPLESSTEYAQPRRRAA
jgi:hypothetical protein